MCIIFFRSMQLQHFLVWHACSFSGASGVSSSSLAVFWNMISRARGESQSANRPVNYWDM